MKQKKFILNADDFGMSEEHNRAVLDGYLKGFLTSTSICANGKAFDTAVNEILPECPDLGIGVHLNIIEGRSLTKAPLLTDKKGIFNNGYVQMILKSFNREFLEQAEYEFRTQIEKVMSYTKVDHIDSHVHVHGIPNLFKITAKLAKEYGIPYIRTQHEQIYFVSSIKKHISFKYPINIIKIMLLNFFTGINRATADNFGLKTNDFIVGVGYTGMMDDETVRCGAEAVDESDCIVETLIHPCNYKYPQNNQHYKEFLITQNKELEDKIIRMGYEITNCKKEFFSVNK